MSASAGRGAAVLDRRTGSGERASGHGIQPSGSIVRILPMPPTEPPTDDDWSAVSWEPPVSTAPVLPLRLRPAAGPPRRRAAVRGAAGAFEVVPAAGRDRPTIATRADGYGEVTVGPDDTRDSPDPFQPPPALAEVRQATQRFIATFIEVTAGFRPIAQLRPCCRPDRFDRISDHLRGRAGTRTTPALRGAAALSGRALIVGRLPSQAPPRAGRAEQRSPGDRVSVRRVQICQVSDSVAEVVAVLGRRGSSAALAFRLEKVQGRWLCAHLEIV